MPKSLSLLDRWVTKKFTVSLRYLCLIAQSLAGAAVLCGRSDAFTQVTISTSAPAGIEQQFIAHTTTYFQSTLFVNPLASNTYAIKILGPGEPVTVLGNSFDECISQGFADGMESERQATMSGIVSRQVVDASSSTCSGVIVDSTTEQDCQFVYGLILTDVNQRNLAVYTSTGGVVTP